MAPSRVGGGLSQSSASSGIFFQGDAQSQNVVINNSHFGPPFGHSANSVSGTGHSNLGPVSLPGAVNQTVLANSGPPSVGASSLVTDANSAFSGGPQLQRSASTNTESYLRLPASPMSFSSNNISASGSSIIDGPPTVDPSAQQANSLPAPQTGGQIPLGMGPRLASSFVQDPSNLSQLQKKPRLDIKQEDILQQQVLQQLLQRQERLQLPGGHNPQLQAILQQQRLRQQQQILQAMPQIQRAHLQQQQQQQQLRQHLQQQSMQQMAAASSMKSPYETGGVCARRLMQYLYHQRQRPAENTIAYWRKFVAEYYAPRAKKRWCLSLYDNVGHHALGVFPQASMDAWHCDICGSKSGRGFEATYEVLPRLNEIKFGSGVVDELLFLDWPRERRFPSGLMILEYGKAVQESVYEQLRVVREGQLRIIFTQELKILSWEFCARCHEELFPRRLVAPQVTQLVQVAQKCQSTHAESGPDGVSTQDLQTNSNMVVTASRHLAKSLELQSLNDLGFSKRYVRCLQIAEVVNSMKDLVDFCRDNKVGPIEGLKNYPRHASAPKLQNQRIPEMDQQIGNIQGLPTDRTTLTKLMAMQQQPGISNPNTITTTTPNTPNMSLPTARGGALGGPAAAAMALTNYQNIMMRQNSINSNMSSHSLQQEQQPSSSLNNSANLSPSSSSFQPGSGGFPNPQMVTRSLSSHSLMNPQNLPNSQSQNPMVHQPGGGGFPNPQMVTRSLSTNSLMNPQNQPNNNQHQMIQQLLHDMSGNNMAGQRNPVLGGQTMNPSPSPSPNPTMSGPGFGNGAPSTPTVSSSTPVGEGMGPVLSKAGSFKASNSDSSAAAGNGGFSNNNNNSNSNNNNSNNNQKAGDFPQSLRLTDDMVPDLPHDFAESGFFSSDLDDNMGYGWKA